MKKCRHMPKLSQFLFKNHRYNTLVCKNCGKRIIPASGKKILLSNIIFALITFPSYISIMMLFISFPELKKWYYLIAFIAAQILIFTAASYFAEMITGYWTEADNVKEDAAVFELRANELIAESEKQRDARNSDLRPQL